MIQATIYILSSSQMNLTQSGLTTTNLVGIHTLKLGKEKKSKKMQISAAQMGLNIYI